MSILEIDKDKKNREQISLSQTVCGCVHHNALTCIAEQNNVSRFNAMILFAKGSNSDGRCTCRCHKTSSNQQVDEYTWNRRMRREVVA